MQYPGESKEYNMTSRGQDVPWWTGDNFEQEWNATSKAGGARIEVLRKYYLRAFERMSTYQRGRLTSVELPKIKSSDPTAEPMFCDSCILDRQDHCAGFTNCVEHTHHTGQRFWFATTVANATIKDCLKAKTYILMKKSERKKSGRK